MTLTLLLPQTALESRSGPGALPPPPQDYLYSFSCRWVSEEQGPSTEKETCRVTFQRASCPVTKALDRTSSPVTTH